MYTTRNIEAKRRGELAARDLSPKAYNFYSNTDPIAILDHGDGRYSVRGFIDEDFNSFEELNTAFEDLADEIAKGE